MTEVSSKLAMTKTILTTVGSVAATAMVARTVLREILPDEFEDYFFSGFRNLFSRFSNDFTLIIDEFDKLANNEIYEAAEVYLGTMVNNASTRRLKISKALKEKNLNVRMEKGDEIVDVFNGVKLKWIWIVNKAETGNHFYNPRDLNSTLKSEVRCFYLTFHKKYKDMVIDSYLPFLLNQAKLMKHEKKTLTLFTVDPNGIYDISSAWMDITLDHPATFDTLAMDSEQKDLILKDLDRFVKRKEYYRKVGKAWKRGYLLYGPPGTGKSSLIAAMANYLNFDIYDLELTAVNTNSQLRTLLVATANKSILVVEDIDCTVELRERATKQAASDSSSDSNKKSDDEEENKVTLSGFLNFIDGLWSSCGDERIIIFTTNHKEKLDPALLRPGRMDVHVHMSYCTPSGFRILASNYLGLKNHPLFEEIEKLIQTTEVTPAEVAEQLLQHDETEATLRGLSDFLHKKKKENEEAKAKKVNEEAKAKKEKEEGVDDGVKEQKGEKKDENQESFKAEKKIEEEETLKK